MAHKGQSGTRFGKAARTHTLWTTKPFYNQGGTLKSVFIIIAESHDGHRWVETAYKSKEKAELICNAKNRESSNGNKFSVLHTPVND